MVRCRSGTRNPIMKKIVVIGGVAGGMSFAARMRRLDETAEIIVIEKSGFVSYANCGLPYFVGGVIEKEESLLLQTPGSLWKRFRLDVRTDSEALRIDREAKQVEVLSHSDGKKYSLPYDYLVYSPGAAPIRPHLSGIERSLSLRNVEDVKRIFDVVNNKPATAVVVGGGFIGVEMAENLVHRGIKTSLVEAQDQVLMPLDPEMVTFVHKELQSKGVNLFLGSALSLITDKTVVLANGTEIEADLVIMAIGVRPEVTLAKATGLEIGERGGVKVDQFNRTSDPSIYAVGDAVEKTDALNNRAALVPLANIANRHGRIIADHIAGKDIRSVNAQGTAIVKVFDLTVATSGWNEKKLTSAGRDFVAVHSHPASHAGYYPGAQGMALKLLMDPKSHQILGVQGVGKEGVDKRIDVIATAMRGGITAPELADLELAYAPPFGSAKDPVNMLGYISENVLSRITPTIQWYEVQEKVQKGYSIIDVRSANEVNSGSIPGSLNIPIDEIRERVDEIPSRKIIVTCQVGQRGHAATRLLRELGYDATNLDGGYMTWSNSPAKTREKVGN
jgi:NADPH-dependent 2,4-dienoyl-CoA reductase/sulfur reductase-like enzyme/rhodanese-related sulfurtransferase